MKQALHRLECRKLSLTLVWKCPRTTLATKARHAFRNNEQDFRDCFFIAKSILQEPGPRSKSRLNGYDTTFSRLAQLQGESFQLILRISSAKLDRCLFVFGGYRPEPGLSSYMEHKASLTYVPEPCLRLGQVCDHIKKQERGTTKSNAATTTSTPTKAHQM